jgi:hypothetical protein
MAMMNDRFGSSNSQRSILRDAVIARSARQYLDKMILVIIMADVKGIDRINGRQT